MARGYSAREVRKRLISVLGGKESGMSGVELAQRMGMSRVTMAKYLKVFAAEGLLRERDIGNVTLWFLESGQESYSFPEDYFRVAEAYLEAMASEARALSLVRNCVRSGADSRRLVLEVMMPAMGAISGMYEQGKIGAAEQSLMHTVLSRSLQVLGAGAAPDPRRSVTVISADSQSRLISEAASAVYRSEGWQVYHLGDMSHAIDVLFDLDLEKLMGKVWKKSGIMIVVVFSGTSEGLRFFADSVNPLRKKSGKRMKLVLCGNTDSKIESDLQTGDLGEALQWSQTVSER